MNQQQDSRTPGNPYGVTTNKFWNFIPAAGDKPPELLLYGAISSQQSWWEDRVTPQQFNQELAALGDVPEIIVRINSGGGDVFAANAIFTRLKDCSAKVTVKIDGWAASAATIIAMAEVAAVMSAKAENINGLFEGEAILDIDCTAETGATYYTEVPAWKKQKNFTKRTEVVCFPKVALGDRVFNLSTQLAASMSAVDNAEEYGGGTPCESASNKGIQADRMVTADGSEVVMDIQQANYLNENGVVTALNFFNGFVSWGNYTACYPANTDVTDYFYCINRMFKWVAKTLVLTYWNYIDRGIKRRLIDAVVQSINDWLASLATDEKIIGGRVEFNESENSTSQLAAGIVRFHIYMTPPSPMQKMDFVLEYDLSYLAALVAA